MDVLIPLPFVIAGALAALGVGYAIALITTDNRHRKIAAERETRIQQEYVDYKRDVSEHFSQSSRLFSQVTDQYRQLYLHMADGARLLGDTPPTPMIERLQRERSSSRRSRTEPQLLEGGLDDALVELRDDLHQFTTRLETRRKQTEANARKLAERHAVPAPAAEPVDLTLLPEKNAEPAPTIAATAKKHPKSRARHRSARLDSERRTPNVVTSPEHTQENVPAPESATPNRVRSRTDGSHEQRATKDIPVLDTDTLRTSVALKAHDEEAVKWQKLVDEWDDSKIARA